MNIRMLGRIVLPAVLCAGLAVVSLPAAGQGGGGVDTPQEAAARNLAEKLVFDMLRKPIKKQPVALLPPDPDEFRDAALGRWGRQRLHVLLSQSLQTAIRTSYEWVDLRRHKDLWRVLQEREGLAEQEQGKPTALDHYTRTVKDSHEQISIFISCEAGPLRQGKFKLTCSAASPERMQTYATASLDAFDSSWLTGPVDPDSAIASIAKDIVLTMRGEGAFDGVVSAVDSEEETETRLARHIADRLQAEVHRTGSNNDEVVEGAAGTTRYHATVKVERFKETLDLHVELYEDAKEAPPYTNRAPMHWEDKLRELDERDRVGGGRPVAGGECEAGVSPGERPLPDEGGLKLKHWALLTEHELEAGDRKYFLKVLVQAKTYLEQHCQWERVKKILAVAIAGLAKELDAEIKENTRRGLQRLLNVEESAGPHLELLLLRASAHEKLGNLREQARAYNEILAMNPDDPAVLLPILKARERIHDEIAAEDSENALELGGRERSLVRRGLASFDHDAGEGSAEFDTRFRVALEEWQASNGRTVTSYLKEDEARALIAAGRAAEERAQDDAAFARAEAADTAEAYRTYLSKFPEGRYVEEARRRLESIRAREDDAAFARAKRADTEASYAAYLSQYPAGRHAAEARRLREAARARGVAEAQEAALELTHEQRALVERGLAAVKSGGGRADGDFDAAFRGALRSWQASKGDQETGYLTANQANTLVDKGREVDERRKDDAAFARAKAANTASAYEAYLSEYPEGRHVAEARRLLEAVRAREDDAAFARAKQADTEASYAAYLSRYPEGRHAAEAKRLREAARVREVAEAAEEALGLTWAERELVQRGLASKVRGGAVSGRFHAAFRAALRSWQASNGHTATGYLTRGQAQALMDLGRDVEKRERDDAAYARAKRTDTVASYTAYLSAYPNGRRAAEARRRLNAIRAEVEEMNRERAQCMATDRSRLAQGSVFCDCAECPVMVVGTGGVAASKYPVFPFTWNACIEDRDCGKFRSRRSAYRPMPLSLEQAQTYVNWLSRKTGKNYRLLNESQRSTGLLDDDSLGGDSLGSPGYRVARNVGRVAGDGAAATEKRLGLSHSQRMLIQRALNALGFDAGVVDGDFGRRTRKALRAWQASRGYEATGYLTVEQERELVAAGQRAEPGHRFRDCDGTWCPEMVVVPAGSFMMGSPPGEEGRKDYEGPVHRVRIAGPIAVGRYEVTRGEFGRFVRETGHSAGKACWNWKAGEWEMRTDWSWRYPGFSQTDAHPVACLRWEDANAYVRWLSTKTGKRYRLLSESEWEYVARAGTRTPFHYGGTISTDQANYHGLYLYGSGRAGQYRKQTVPVGSFPPNAFGLHDLHGNVLEFVEDCWHDSYAGAPGNGRAWTVGGDCKIRVTRGGSWHSSPRQVRSAFRGRKKLDSGSTTPVSELPVPWISRWVLHSLSRCCFRGHRDDDHSTGHQQRSPPATSPR